MKTKGIEEGFSFETEAGVSCELQRETVHVLTAAIAHAAQAFGEETESKWIEEQEVRRTRIDGVIEHGRAEKRLRAAEAAARGEAA